MMDFNIGNMIAFSIAVLAAYRLGRIDGQAKGIIKGRVRERNKK